MDDSDRKSNVKQCSQSLQPKRSGQYSSCWLLPGQRFRNLCSRDFFSSPSTMEKQLLVLYTLWRKRHQSPLTNREAEAQSSALPGKQQLTTYFLCPSSILCPLGCTDSQQFPNSTSYQREHNEFRDKEIQPDSLYTFISRH